MDPDLNTHCRSFIAIAEACWRKENPSYSWHILDWMAYKSRLRWPLVRESDQVINWGGNCS